MQSINGTWSDHSVWLRCNAPSPLRFCLLPTNQKVRCQALNHSNKISDSLTNLALMTCNINFDTHPTNVHANPHMRHLAHAQMPDPNRDTFLYAYGTLVHSCYTGQPMPCPPLKCQDAHVAIVGRTLSARNCHRQRQRAWPSHLSLHRASHFPRLEVLLADEHDPQEHARRRMTPLPDQANPLVAS